MTNEQKICANSSTMVYSLITFKKDKPHMEEAIDSPIKFPFNCYWNQNHSGCIGLEQITTAFWRVT